MDSSQHSEIAFFDVETTVPARAGQSFSILEFGAILVCPRKLIELRSYSTLVQPSDLTAISAASVRCNGITKDAVANAPLFRDVAREVYNILHGRIWAGHNIVRFDCVRIREAFAETDLLAPEPKAVIDSLALLTQKFGRRAGDMKMASLAAYFGLGKQIHRSLDDVRMNLEVLKYCATVLFLESSLPEIFPVNSWVSPSAITRSRSAGKDFQGGRNFNTSSSSSVPMFENHHIGSALNETLETRDLDQIDTTKPDPFNITELIHQMNVGTIKPDASTEGALPDSPKLSNTLVSEGCRSYSAFLEPEEISELSLSACFIPSSQRSQKIQILHNNVLLQLHCAKMTVRFGISKKFYDLAGRPRLSFVVDAPPGLCRVLDTCDCHTKKLSADSGSSSEWRPVIRKIGFLNSSTIRLQIPTVANGDIATYSTEIYHKDAFGDAQRLIFNRINVAELDSLFVPGTSVDAFFFLDTYDYKQFAGVRLVAEKLIVNS
ncbi:hypothetical protein Syun_021089 [Stephania yunnanensis]|uniref:Exonuclease domain-containing protein n=1 Tax=Stephania yunnanensis TaxID=152371 RepID=A0AAP0NNU6_9MAGN